MAYKSGKGRQVRANSQRNEFVVSKISVFGETNPTHTGGALRCLGIQKM